MVRGRRVEYSIGFAITENVRDAIDLVLPEVWTLAVDADGGIREGGTSASLTGLLDLTMPEGMGVIVRRERPHPGAQACSLFEGARRVALPGARHQHPGRALAFLEARHRAHARVEDRIRHGKDSGLGRFPSRGVRDQPGLAHPHDDRGRPHGLDPAARPDRRQAGAGGASRKVLRYRFLHTPARLTHGGRRRRLRTLQSWPWAAAIVAVFANIAAIPQPA